MRKTLILIFSQLVGLAILLARPPVSEVADILVVGHFILGETTVWNGTSLSVEVIKIDANAKTVKLKISSKGTSITLTADGVHPLAIPDELFEPAVYMAEIKKDRVTLFFHKSAGAVR